MPVQYVNYKGSISEFLMICDLTTLSITFIAREVMATGWRSFRALTVPPYFWMGMAVESFHSSGTVLQAKGLWNRGWNMSPRCSAQYLRLHLLMVSGQGAE